jgi:hypothetical protein
MLCAVLLLKSMGGGACAGSLSHAAAAAGGAPSPPRSRPHGKLQVQVQAAQGGITAAQRGMAQKMDETAVLAGGCRRSAAALLQYPCSAPAARCQQLPAADIPAAPNPFSSLCCPALLCPQQVRPALLGALSSQHQCTAVAVGSCPAGAGKGPLVPAGVTASAVTAGLGPAAAAALPGRRQQGKGTAAAAAGGFCFGFWGYCQ